jgi:hypothetical protein
LEELLSHLASVNGERPQALIRTEIVYFETAAGGAWRPFSLPYEVQAFPWSGRAPCARASASDM